MFCPNLPKVALHKTVESQKLTCTYIDWSSSSADTEAVPVLPTTTFHCGHEICHILHSGTYVALYLTCIQNLREKQQPWHYSYSPHTHTQCWTYNLKNKKMDRAYVPSTQYAFRPPYAK